MLCNMDSPLRQKFYRWHAMRGEDLVRGAANWAGRAPYPTMGEHTTCAVCAKPIDYWGMDCATAVDTVCGHTVHGSCAYTFMGKVGRGECEVCGTITPDLFMKANGRWQYSVWVRPADCACGRGYSPDGPIRAGSPTARS